MSITVDPRGWVRMSTIVDRLTEMTYCYFYHIQHRGKVINFISASKELRFLNYFIGRNDVIIIITCPPTHSVRRPD